jgi:membrane-associated phospholipid phosphatase
VRRRRRDPIADDGWTSEVSSGFALAGFLGVVFVGFTLLAMGPLIGIDAYFNLDSPPRAWVPFLHVMDRIGQRAVCLPVLGVVAYWLCRRNQSWRPGVIAAASVFFLNLLVLILKLGLGRDSPHTADPSFFSGGMAYPSGHSSNIVLVYGVLAYLVMRYSRPSRALRMFLWGMVPVLSVVMVFTSLTLDWHWFADLIAGLIVGGIVLQLTVSLDHVVPDAGFAYGWRTGLRDVLGALRPRRPGAGDAATPQRSGVPEVTSPEQPPVVPRSGARSGSGHPETGSPARPG